MRTIYILILCLFMCIFNGNPLHAQTCGPEPVIDPDSLEGAAFFNFGCVSRAKSNTYKSAVAVGQIFLGFTENLTYNSTLGFYSRYYLPPFALKVKATQGDLLDRIQITWEIDALGPSPSEGFNIYRDSVFLAKVDANIRSYNDFNVIAGRPYTYTVRGLNVFGEGTPSDAIGFQVPNGVVTGWISTISGSPVPDASVTLTPMQGFSARFMDGNGALALEETGTNPFLPALDEDWTITFWIKTDTAGSFPGKLIGMPGLYIRSRPNTGGQNGIAIATTPGGTALLAINFPSKPDDWHHVALSYDGNGNKIRLYFDGKLMGTSPITPVASPDTLNFGELAGPGLWEGRLDEVRIYHHKLDELDFDMVMEGTASAETPYLTHYWKMDEELGEKSFDIVKRHKLYFCGAGFDADRPPVHTAGITNEDGYYRIESASYGTGTTFLAKPKKNFYFHRALKFERAESDYATLPDFPITKKATIEMWVNSAGPDNFQCLLAKKWGANNEFRIVLAPNGNDNEVRAVLNENVRTFGLLGSGYQHLAFTWDSTSRTMKLYKNGAQLGTAQTFPLAAVNTGDWSDPDPAKSWVLGKRHDNTVYYGGLIDEVAFYDTTLSVQAIQNHVDTTRDIQERGLRVYFPLDEGSGNNLNNAGSLFLNGGSTFGTEWSPLAVHQVIEPHVFAPSTRQVTLNPSVTSVDQVDFTDRSTIVVTGYVRYTNTDCFANNVEILVNGQSFIPKIVTDSTGKFTIDFDPGTTARLTPKFDDHVFVPAFWEVTNLSSPIAGILFNDVTTHKITVKVKGGLCGSGLNITPPSAECIVKVRSGNDCLERTTTLNGSGTFVFNNLPPLDVMEIAIVKHNDPAIKAFFDDLGGSVLDISKRDTVIEFRYIAPPQVVIVNGLDTLDGCDKIVLEQFVPVQLKIKLKEHYFGGDCFIDTASFHIINGWNDEVVDTVMGNSLLEYDFNVGTPNPTPPHNKTLQIIGERLDGIEASLTVSAIVLGIRAKENTFTTLMPEVPSLILRDPPGDGSYSFLEKNEKFCTTTELISELETGFGSTAKVLLGGETEYILAPLGLGYELDIGSSINFGVEGQLTYKLLSSRSFETCVSFDQRISTSDGDLIVGGERGADLYMGSALNIIFGNVDIVTFDTMNCIAMDSTAVLVQPGDFATTFIYSEFYIDGVVIPNLEKLAEDPDATPEDVDRYLESIDRWQNILAYNKERKDDARFIRNLSFDAGIELTYSETSDTTDVDALTNLGNSEFKVGTDFKIAAMDIGVEGSLVFITNTSNGGKDEQGTSKGITTGFLLKDDDPLDAFTFDVAMDSVYKTPVFNIKAGQSSCPWEPGTANREGTNLHPAVGSGFTAINVPANEPAVFQLILGNQSATNEDWTYGFTAIEATNPHGAIIKLNGAILNSVHPYIIPYGDSQMITLTIERGPVEYEYDNLLVAEISACEYDRHLALSIPVDDDPNFFSGINLSAHFIRPCSEVNITSPNQDWVIFPNPATPPAINDNLLGVTISGYDLNEPVFKLIRLQYRQSDGDGAWINIAGTARYNPNWNGTIPPGSQLLGDIYTTYSWNTGGLSDGPYEIRALAECNNAEPNQNGYSEIIEGRIDRQPPKLIGVPQPSDGVLHVGDEISFTFNQPIDCDKIVPVDDVKLFDATTNTLISNNFTCSDNKIIIDPLFQNEFYENHILRAELDTIRDLTGNAFKGTFLNNGKWEFYLDRNELAWLTDSAGITKYEDEFKSVTVQINNRGGYPVPFSIDAPDWVHVTPDAGTLVANEIRDIQFTAGDTLDIEWFKDSITLTTESGENPFFMGGVEKLPFDVRNICRPPDWVVNTALYQQTMTLSLRIKIDDAFSADPEDQIAAFINGQLRGTAKLTKTNVPNPNTWVAFMTLYGNAGDAGKDVIFELFDADACLHYPAIFSAGDTITFTENGTQGSPSSPRVLINIGYLIHEIPVKTGWNWISFNLGFPNPAINKVLNNIPNPSGDLVKNKTTFSANVNNVWTGSLTTIGNESMYMYQSTKNNTIKITGNALTPPAEPITLVSGWNWISYIPDDRIPINTALASISPPPTAGDVIKSQNAFAQYVNNTTKWVGSMTHLQAPNGYLLRSASGGTLTYPASFSGDDFPSTRIAPRSSYWNVDASKFEHNMTLIGVFEYDKTNATTAGMELGAFVGNELRGASQAVYIDFLNSYMFFLTTFSNKSGEQIHFKLYDAETGEILDLHEKMTFTPNSHQGSIETPVPFTLQTTGIGDVQSELSFNVQPNPFRDETVCRIELPHAQDVRLIVTDMDGKVLYVKHLQANTGMNTFIWKGCSTVGAPLSNGIYFIRMETEQGVLTKKVMLQR